MIKVFIDGSTGTTGIKLQKVVSSVSGIGMMLRLTTEYNSREIAL